MIVLDGRGFPDLPECAASEEATGEGDEGEKGDGAEAVSEEDVQDGAMSDLEAEHTSTTAPQTKAADAEPYTMDEDEPTGGDAEAEPLLLTQPLSIQADPLPTAQTLTTAPTTHAHAAAPTLRAHVLLGNHQQSMKMSSCLQADARSVYLTYWAAGEAEDGMSDAATAPTPEALFGLGLCVKVWTFCA